MLEILWVLRSLLRPGPEQTPAKIERILAADSPVVENEQQFFEVAFALKQGMGVFEDALIGALNAWAGCERTI